MESPTVCDLRSADTPLRNEGVSVCYRVGIDSGLDQVLLDSGRDHQTPQRRLQPAEDRGMKHAE